MMAAPEFIAEQPDAIDAVFPGLDGTYPLWTRDANSAPNNLGSSQLRRQGHPTTGQAHPIRARAEVGTLARQGGQPPTHPKFTRTTTWTEPVTAVTAEVGRGCPLFLLLFNKEIDKACCHCCHCRALAWDSDEVASTDAVKVKVGCVGGCLPFASLRSMPSMLAESAATPQHTLE
jgi:hypothetical protein